MYGDAEVVLEVAERADHESMNVAISPSEVVTFEVMSPRTGPILLSIIWACVTLHEYRLPKHLVWSHLWFR